MTGDTTGARDVNTAHAPDENEVVADGASGAAGAQGESGRSGDSRPFGETESFGDADAFGDRVTDELPRPARKALVILLTHRFITRAKQPDAWKALLDSEPDIRARLDELFLELVIDRDHEVAFKRQNGEDDVPVLLRNEKPLSRDATFLLIHLRREHAFADAADDAVVVSRDEIAEFLSRFDTDESHDEVRSHRRVAAAIAAVERLGLLDAEPDDPELFVVSPAIVPVITTTELARFEQVYLAGARDDENTSGVLDGGPGGGAAPGDDEDGTEGRA
ncbi:DUF4194 domain-containing protein [Pseudoclavibacter chungangensis]|uniref:DUF4194 domain-containing protein n=1 Tax=Pseudoclavibacter chungangensis TaxID=587635 RepID=A0A7J5BPU2_9MICO|nr:DUF4194 domain-containing protein [Pseudoclavibacter chungangensis]KAB1654309.1 DUF4194 domain-containing protein [Pseudoclavibacter chungangensis]NYJ65282.1 hypothetical protein [Pseudoclavibacter chungangensis]